MSIKPNQELKLKKQIIFTHAGRFDFKELSHLSAMLAALLSVTNAHLASGWSNLRLKKIKKTNLRNTPISAELAFVGQSNR